MTNYSADFQFDEQNGWYLANETYDWELDSNTETPSTTNVADSSSNEG
jgi:hypothetical protein